MSFISCNESGVITLDYSLEITMKIGVERLNQLQEYLAEIPNRNKIRLLADFRQISFDSEETHLALSEKGRALFFKEYPNLNLAILNPTYANAVSEHEQWFTEKEAALNWLYNV